MPMHSHEHIHSSDFSDAEELRALLDFSLKHNVSHTGELNELAEKLKQSGNIEAAEKILSAAEEYNKGNELLLQALDSVK